MSTSTKHSDRAPSGAGRWLECPGSVDVIRTLTDEERDTTSVYAREGTAAHKLAEYCLQTVTEPRMYLGRNIDGFLVTEEMARATHDYVEACAEHFDAEVCGTETRIPLPWDPDNSGTVDFHALHSERTILEIIDFKYGQGVRVDAENNPQLMLYAYSLLQSDRMKFRNVDTVNLQVVQPRWRDDGNYTKWVVPRKFLDYWYGYCVVPRLTENYLRVGKHCKFCPAAKAAKCPEQQKQIENSLSLAFTRRTGVTQPRPPMELSDEQLRTILDYGDAMKTWIDSVRNYTKDQVQKGRSIEGYKLVSGRSGNRKFVEGATDQLNQAVAFFFENNNPEDMYTQPKPEVVSPAQFEKAYGAEGKRFLKRHPDLITQSTNLDLVPESDKRKAITFDDLFADVQPDGGRNELDT